MKKLFLAAAMATIGYSSYAQNTYPWSSSGNIGIGTTNPAYTLDVNGIIRSSGNIIVPSINNQYIGYGTSGAINGFAVGTSVLNGNNNTGYANIAVGTNVLSGPNLSGYSNVGIGNAVLPVNTTGSQNISIGGTTLLSNITGTDNVAIGYQALKSNVVGNNSIAIGTNALALATGDRNVAIGAYAGNAVTNGIGNTFVGFYTTGHVTGSNNTIIGGASSYSDLGLATGSGNTIIGANISALFPNLTNSVVISDGVGNKRLFVNDIGSTGMGTDWPMNKLHIVSTRTADGLSIDGTDNPAIILRNNRVAKGYGLGLVTSNGSFFANAVAGDIIIRSDSNKIHLGVGSGASTLTVAGNNVGIGTSIPDAKLAVNGTIHSSEVKVDLNVPGPDYVFKPDYQLMSLNEVKAYVDRYHHLPEIPSADQMAKDGLNLGDMNTKLLKKVEELTLYLIEKDKQLQTQHDENKHLQDQIDELQKQFSVLLKSQKSK